MPPLSMLTAGESGRIAAINADHHTISRLHSTGFSVQTQVQMIQNAGKGPLIVFVRGTEIALGRREADTIMITCKNSLEDAEK
ncbi:MAG: ferrous iron transport protein A [Deltaproteobacteria bacterium]|nr:MAG: ferrous iron transport protein A [Deltaproteobacteria bacterium]